MNLFDRIRSYIRLHNKIYVIVQSYFVVVPLLVVVVVAVLPGQEPVFHPAQRSYKYKECYLSYRE